MSTEVFDTVKDVFSIIGVLATTGGLAWRVKAWRHERGTHVRVSVANAFPAYGPELGERHFSIKAINKGDRTIVVSSAGFEVGDGRSAVMLNFPFGDTLPKELAPGGTCEVYQPVENLRLSGFKVTGPIVAFVLTAADERFRSEPRELM